MTDQKLLDYITNTAVLARKYQADVEAARETRNECIVDAYRGGHTIQAIAKASGMTESGVRGVLRGGQ